MVDYITSFYLCIPIVSPDAAGRKCINTASVLCPIKDPCNGKDFKVDNQGTFHSSLVQSSSIIFKPVLSYLSNIYFLEE